MEIKNIMDITDQVSREIILNLIIPYFSTNIYLTEGKVERMKKVTFGSFFRNFQKNANEIASSMAKRMRQRIYLCLENQNSKNNIQLSRLLVKQVLLELANPSYGLANFTKKEAVKLEKMKWQNLCFYLEQKYPRTLYVLIESIYGPILEVLRNDSISFNVDRNIAQLVSDVNRIYGTNDDYPSIH